MNQTSNSGLQENNCIIVPNFQLVFTVRAHSATFKKNITSVFLGVSILLPGSRLEEAFSVPKWEEEASATQISPDMTMVSTHPQSLRLKDHKLGPQICWTRAVISLLALSCGAAGSPPGLASPFLTVPLSMGESFPSLRREASFSSLLLAKKFCLLPVFLYLLPQTFLKA